MSQSKPVIPRFMVLYWTKHSPESNVESVGDEGALASLLKQLREDNEVTEFATYSFSSAQQREVSFRQINP